MPNNNLVICNLSYVKGLMDGATNSLIKPDFNIDHFHEICKKAANILEKTIADLEKEAEDG